jgi:hypothetical protein
MYGKNDDDLWGVTATYFGTDPTLCVTNKKRGRNDEDRKET